MKGDASAKDGGCGCGIEGRYDVNSEEDSPLAYRVGS
jgi:hypothetical protein